MTNIYNLNHDKLVEGVEVTYTNGLLENIKFPVKYPVKPSQHSALMEHIPMLEEVLQMAMGLLGIRVSEPSGTYHKIKLFCDKYMEYKNGLKYRVLPKDQGKIKLVPVNKPVLDAYFKSKAFEIVGRDGNGKHSISNFVDTYNQLMQEIASSGKTKFPDHWDKDFIAKMAPADYGDYYSHLRSKGLVVKKDRLGNILDWVSADKINK